MITEILDTVKKYDMLSKGDSVLIALSGGADSILLAHFLLQIKEEYALDLIAAHVEHGIRGEESMEDAAFCEEFCKKNGIPFKILHIDAPKEAKHFKMGVEEYSRKARYAFFDTIDCDKIATAHNLSDSIETLLFRMARGTSLKGMCGIPPKRGKIIRPLIGLSSSEIRAYLNRNKIPFRIDSTNHDDGYSRNYIRNQILPLMNNLNAQFEKHTSRLLESIQRDEDFLEKHTDRIYNGLFSDHKLIIDRFNKLSASEKYRVIARWLNENHLPVNDNVISGVLALSVSNSRFQICGNVYAVSAAGSIRIADIHENNGEICFKVSENVISVKEFLNKCEFHNKPFDFYCDCDKIVGNVVVRSRKAGDEISIQGRNCTKNLKKYFNELHIPPEIRNSIPVIADDNGIIGIAGYAVSQRAAVDSNTKNILILYIRTEDKA